MTEAAAPAGRTIPEGIRPTRVGVWFVVLTLIIGIAGTNTGNNGLYMVMAVMFSTLIISGVLSRNNVRQLAAVVSPPSELFVGEPALFRLEVSNDSRLMPRWLLMASLAPDRPGVLFPYLSRRGRGEAAIEIVPQERGVHAVRAVHFSTLFPLGFFSKGMRRTLNLEVIVYPSLIPGDVVRRDSGDSMGARLSGRAGWGFDLHSLRPMRPGDDPRRIHWKQTARTGEMVFMEREAEESRRLSIVLDNAVDPAGGELERQRFERRISAAASAAVEHLGQGWDVELVTRTVKVSFGSGSRQRRRLLEALALLNPTAIDPRPLAAAAAREVRFDR